MASMAVAVAPQSQMSKLCHLSKRAWVTAAKTGSQKFCSSGRKTEACGLSRDPRRKRLSNASLGAWRPLTALTGPVPSQCSFFGNKMFLAEILAPLEKLEDSESPMESVWLLLKGPSTPLGSRFLGCCDACRVLQQTNPRRGL